MVSALARWEARAQQQFLRDLALCRAAVRVWRWAYGRRARGALRTRPHRGVRVVGRAV